MVIDLISPLDKCSSPWIQQPLLGIILWHNRRNHNDSSAGIYHLLFCSCKHHLSHHSHLYQDIKVIFLSRPKSNYFYLVVVLSPSITVGLSLRPSSSLSRLLLSLLFRCKAAIEYLYDKHLVRAGVHAGSCRCSCFAHR